MNPSEVHRAAAFAHLTVVDERLRDLPADDHAQLLADVEARLDELEPGRGPVDALGRPEEFAAELRRSAGFPTAHDKSPGTTPTMSDWFRRLASRPAAAATVDYAASLRPAWWALCGYLLVAFILAASNAGDGWGLHTLGHYSQNQDARGEHVTTGGLWLLVVVAAVLASIVVGRLRGRTPIPFRLLIVAVNVLAAVTFVLYPTWWLGPAFAYFTDLVG